MHRAYLHQVPYVILATHLVEKSSVFRCLSGGRTGQIGNYLNKSSALENYEKFRSYEYGSILSFEIVELIASGG